MTIYSAERGVPLVPMTIYMKYDAIVHYCHSTGVHMQLRMIHKHVYDRLLYLFEQTPRRLFLGCGSCEFQFISILLGFVHEGAEQKVLPCQVQVHPALCTSLTPGHLQPSMSVPTSWYTCTDSLYHAARVPDATQITTALIFRGRGMLYRYL